MDLPLTKITYCFYVDNQGNVYFSPSDFVRHHGLSGSPEFRRVVAEDIKELWPEVTILMEES
jgi:hypothetical protein